MTDADNAGGYACVWEISAPPQFHCKSRTSLLKINSLKKSESRYDADQRKKQMLAPVLWDASPGGLSLHSSPLWSPLTQRPGWSKCKGLSSTPCLDALHKPLLCYKHPQTEFVFLGHGYTNPYWKNAPGNLTKMVQRGRRVFSIERG